MKYTDQDIISVYDNLTSKIKVEVLYSAISYMQQYNGRSVDECISLAMQDRFTNLKNLMK